MIISKYNCKKDPFESNSSQGEDKSTDSSNNKLGIVKCIETLVDEILQFRDVIENQAKEIDYYRQKENKLMYLFFTLHKKGIDVNSVYEAELKDVPTDRFNEWIKEQMDEEDQPPEISFESQASYEPIHEGPMPQPIRPHCVPKLVLDTIPDYVTSSDEDDNESLDGSKIHRKSEFVSEASMSFYGKEPAHTRYKEDYSLSKEKKRDIFKNERINDNENPFSNHKNRNSDSFSQNTENENLKFNI